MKHQTRRNTIQSSPSSFLTIWVILMVCWSVAMVVSTMLVCCPSSSTLVVPFYDSVVVVEDARKSVDMPEVGWTTYKTWTRLTAADKNADFGQRQPKIPPRRLQEDALSSSSSFVVEDLTNWQVLEEKTSSIIMKAFLMQICHQNLRRAIHGNVGHVREQRSSAHQHAGTTTLAVVLLDATSTTTNAEYFLAASISSLVMYHGVARIVVVGGNDDRKLLDRATTILQDALTAVASSSKKGTTISTKIHRLLSEIVLVGVNKPKQQHRRRSFAHVQDAVLSATTTFSSFAMVDSIVWMPFHFVLAQFPDMPRTLNNGGDNVMMLLPHRYPPPLPHHVAILMQQEQKQSRCWTISSKDGDDDDENEEE